MRPRGSHNASRCISCKIRDLLPLGEPSALIPRAPIRSPERWILKATSPLRCSNPPARNRSTFMGQFNKINQVSTCMGTSAVAVRIPVAPIRAISLLDQGLKKDLSWHPQECQLQPLIDENVDKIVLRT